MLNQKYYLNKGLLGNTSKTMEQNVAGGPSTLRTSEEIVKHVHAHIRSSKSDSTERAR